MDFDHLSGRQREQAHQQAVISVRPKDQVVFSCRLCGECCRHVEDSIMLEPLDAYNLGRYLREHGGGVDNIEDVYGRFAHPSMLDDIYPIFLLNTQGKKDQSCVFLEDGRCSVYESRPRVCRLYPFAVKDGERGHRFSYYQCLDSHASHFDGGKVTVGDWMYHNFTKDARDFVELEVSVLSELAELLKKLGPDGRRQFLFRLLYYRYYNYELDQPFLPQYQENQRQLIHALREEV